MAGVGETLEMPSPVPADIEKARLDALLYYGEVNLKDVKRGKLVLFVWAQSWLRNYPDSPRVPGWIETLQTCVSPEHLPTQESGSPAMTDKSIG